MMQCSCIESPAVNVVFFHYHIVRKEPPIVYTSGSMDSHSILYRKSPKIIKTEYRRDQGASTEPRSNR